MAVVADIHVRSGQDAGRSAELEAGGRIHVGRSAECDLRLRDPGVSRLHCVVQHVAGGVVVEDQGSAQGTTMGDERLRPFRKRAVAERVVLCLGPTTRLEVVLRAAPATTFPEVPGLAIERELGRGGNGVVYEARTSGGARVALKLLLPDADAAMHARQARESALLRRLEHPAIARMLDVGCLASRPYLVRELVPGESLEAHVHRLGPLPWQEALRLGVALAEGLEHAHQRGVAHRDVKPGNVILTPDGAAKLIDFDLARPLTASLEALTTRITGSGEGLGTWAYVAPEQLESAHRAGPQSDVYGLGLTLYFALSGVQPFSEVAPEEFITAVFERGPAPLAHVAPGLGAALYGTLEAAYARAARARFASARALGSALEALLAS